MDRDEEIGHGDRSLLFIGDEDDDLGADRDGGSPPTSSDEGSFSEQSGDERDAPDDGQKGTWPQSYRFVDHPTNRLMISDPPLLSPCDDDMLAARMRCVEGFEADFSSRRDFPCRAGSRSTC